MIIRQLVLERFMSHDSTTLDVPERGLIAVVGANGSGKSSLIEAVPHALWGKSLRGKLGWRRRKYGSKVTIVLADGTKVSRSRENDTSHIEIIRGGSKRDDDLYDTARKAQPQIDQAFGSFDVWRRTAVFSSSDAAHFSLATDAERKRLLETILGLERFDGALDSCRTDLRAAQTRVTERAGAVERIEAQRTATQARLTDARADLAALVEPRAPEPEPEPLAPEPEPEPMRPSFAVEVTPAFDGDPDALFEQGIAIDKRIAELSLDLQDADDACTETESQRRVAISTLKSAKVEVEALGTDEACSRCGQSIVDIRKQLARKLAGIESGHESRLAVLNKQALEEVQARQELRDALEAAQAERKEIDGKIAAARRQNQEHEASSARARDADKQADAVHKKAIASWRDRVAAAKVEHEKRVAAARARAKQATEQHERALAEHRARVKTLRDREREIAGSLLDFDDELEAAQQERDEATRDVAELEACEEALGLRGIRAHVLGRALGGIESVANYWLSSVVGPGLRLTLKPYSEKKTGGVNDMISLSIEGAGEGDYLGASGGERRRFDVAILLALAEVARAANGSGAGTIFFDEVFDALDREGQAMVAEALRELADERAVFVITHSEDLARDLHADMFVHVKEGKLRVVA